MESKKTGVGQFILAGTADGFQFFVGFLNFIPIIGNIIAIGVSFVISMGTFLAFGIFFGKWFPFTFVGESIPIINSLAPFWTARVIQQHIKEKIPKIATDDKTEK